MTDQTTQEAANESYLNMSDEEMSKIDPSTLVAPAQAEEVAESVDEVPARESVDKEDAEETKEVTEDVDDTAKKASDEQEGKDAKESDSGESETKPVQDSTPKADEIDYKAEYTKLFAPFKANGKEIAISNADDAISLMQMGANYNKKMAALKPNLKLLKLLENNNLLSEEKIGFLIDLEKKNPDAINKLIKDSGLDPMDLDAEKASGYKPNTYTVDDREMELDTVLDEIQSTPSYNRTLEIVSTKWDGPSKQVIAGSPQLLKVINDHVQTGIYDTIIKEVERERMFGRLNGLSDIDAYKAIGDAINARGGFNHLGNQGQETPPKPVVVTPKPKQVDEDKLKEKRRAASSTKPASSNVTPKDFNPLALSDEDFGKLVHTQFL